jgi:hypothetical protein
MVEDRMEEAILNNQEVAILRFIDSELFYDESPWSLRHTKRSNQYSNPRVAAEVAPRDVPELIARWPLTHTPLSSQGLTGPVELTNGSYTYKGGWHLFDVPTFLG